MNAAEIRAEYAETMASTECDWLMRRLADRSWESITPEELREWREVLARLWVDALAAAGKLPTEVEGRYIGRGLQRRTRYVTEWVDLPNVSEFPNSSSLESGGQTAPMPPRPHIGTSG